MKRTLKTIMLCMLAVLLVCSVSCAPKADNTGDTAPTGAVSNTQDPDIVGKWNSPAPINDNYKELWVFEANGAYHLYQVNDDYSVRNAIDGTYVIDGKNLSVTMQGYTLTYGYTMVDDNTLKLEDHGTTETYTRYTGEIKK